MGAPPDVISALLAQYGLMGPQGNPQPQTGLMGALNAATAPYGGPAQAGLAMMANTSGATNPMAALSQGLLNSQQLSLNNQSKQLQNAGLAQELAQRQNQMRMMQKGLPAWLNFLGAAQPGGQGMTPAQGQPQQPSASPQASPASLAQQSAGGGASMAPAGAPSGPQQTPQINPNNIATNAAASGEDRAYALMRGGMLGSVFGMPGASQAFEMGKTLLANDPQLATKLAAAKSEVSQDQLLYQQAQASGDPTMMQGARMKLLKDMGLVSVAQYNGTVTTLGGITPQMLGASILSPTTGTQVTNGVESVIPGAVGARGAIAAAQARGEATGKTVELTDTTGAITGQKGAKYTVPMSAIVGGPGITQPPSAPIPALAGPAAATSPPGAAPSAAVSELGPQQQTFLGTRGKEAGDYLTESQTAAENARDTNYSLDQMLQAAQNVQLGPGAPARAWGEKWLGGIGQQFGIQPSGELANYSELEKYSNKIAFASARQMGSREAAQIVQLQMQSNPNKSMVPQAFQGVALSMKAMNNYIIDKNAYLQTQGENSQGAGAQWVQQVDPRVWALTLSPQLGQQWAATLGKQKISQAYQYMTPEERQALIANIPLAVRKQWLPTS